MAILFDEILFDPLLVNTMDGSRFPISGTLEYANTSPNNPITGHHKTNVNRPDPTYTISMELRQQDPTDTNYIINFIRGGYGSGVGFRCRYFPDYTMTEQVIGTISAGQTKTINLVKTYKRPGASREDVRRIIKPVTNSNLVSGSVTLYEPDGVTLRVISTPLAIKVGGVSTGFTHTVKNTTGEITIVSTTASGIVTCSCEFDTPVAFIGNSFTHDFDVPSEIKGVMMREILPYELGII
jgi:hypothetical protein